MKTFPDRSVRDWRIAELWRSLATALCLLAIVAGIPGMSRAMLSPLFSTIEVNVENETESESPTEESTAESISVGLVFSRARDLRFALSRDHLLPIKSAIRRSCWNRVDNDNSRRCRGAADLLALRC